MSGLLRTSPDQGMRYAGRVRAESTPINIEHGDTIMMKTIVTLACCAFITPLAFAQTHKKQTATTEQSITVTGTVVETKPEEGSAANYQPFKTIVIREDKSNKPGSYVLTGRGNVVDKRGDTVKTAVKPGTRVRVYYTNVGDQRVIDHVVVLD